MSKIEEELERKAWKYVNALREKGILISHAQAMREIDEAHRKAGVPICGSHYLTMDDRNKLRDALIEQSYREEE